MLSSQIFLVIFPFQIVFLYFIMWITSIGIIL
jgi:hypothetical protein